MNIRILLFICFTSVFNFNGFCQQFILDNATELQLTKEQITSLSSIQSEYKEKRSKIDINSPKAYIKIAELQEEKKNKINAILSKDQKTNLKQLKDKFKESKNNKEYKTEIKTYKKNVIKPYLDIKRDELENRLDDEDKKNILETKNQLKQQLKTAKDEYLADTTNKVKYAKIKYQVAKKIANQEAEKKLEPTLEKMMPIMMEMHFQLEAEEQKWKKEINDIKIKYQLKPDNKLESQEDKTAFEQKIRRRSTAFLLHDKDSNEMENEETENEMPKIEQPKKTIEAPKQSNGKGKKSKAK